MNILFVSGHPAQVHNFRNVRAELIKDGHQVFWLTTPKDIATNLLDVYGIPYEVLRKPNKGIVSKAWTILRNVLWEIKYLRHNKIDIAVTRTCPYTTIAAKLCGVKHIILDDTEHAAAKTTFMTNIVNEVLVPECFWFQLRKDELRFPGNIEIHYLHPNRFTPSPVWDLLGIEPDTRFAIVRFVKWDAWHDTQLVGGFTLDQKRELIHRLAAHLRVFISSESELPSDLEPYRIHIPIQRMHDVQAAAALFVGESATMASESVVLGTPSIYIDEVGRGYTDEEAREGLLWMFRPVANRNSLIIEDQKNTEKNTELSADTDSIQNVTAPQSACEQAPRQTDDPFRSTDIVAQSLSDNPVQKTQKIISSNEVGTGKVEPWWISGGVQECIAKAEEIASPDFDTTSYAKRHQAWMATKIDCTAFLTYFIEGYPATVKEVRGADESFWERFR